MYAGSMLRLTPCAALACAALGAAAAIGPAADAPAPAAAGKRLALLVGCTRYPENGMVPELWGPANDAPKLADVLHNRFGFADADVTKLVGWPDDPARRPTYANITAAFKELVAKADADTQVFILLSGHGVRLPVMNPAKAQRWKANHLAFLPADVKSWSADHVENALVDDEILGYLDAMRQKGASVLVFFDCCHAGSMTRGTDNVERVRSVMPQALGVPDSALEAAAQKARDGAKNDPAPGERSRGAELLPAGLDLADQPKGKGNVTAFFACQPFEEAPELPRPADAPQVQENYYGLLTFTLTTALNEQGSALTYRELAHLLTARYKAERGTRGPTPLVEGDLDREVLGQKEWPRRSAIVLERHPEKTSITAGALMGVTQGSVLAVHPPAGEPNGDKTILGYVHVVAVQPGQADVEPCEYQGAPAVSADKLPEGGVCVVVQHDLGDLRIKLAVAKSNDPARAALNAALEKLSPEIKDLIRIIPDEADAEWILDLEGGKAVLRQGVGAKVDPKAVQDYDKTLAALNQPVPRRVYGGYATDDATVLAGRLETDFQKIYTWQSVWRIAGAGEENPSASVSGLKFEVVPLGDGDKPADPLPPGATVRSGQRTVMRLTNDGDEDLYVTLVSLGADMDIHVMTRSLKHSDSLTEKGTIKSKTFGLEGMVVLATPQTATKNEPRYDFLEQDPLREAGKTRGDRMRGMDKAPKTPFGELMKTALIGKGSRGWEPDVDTTPLVLSRSWTTVPAGP